MIFWKESLEVAFGGDDGGTIAESPALGKAVDVRIDGKSRDAKGLGHHNAGCFMPHARKCLEGLKAVGYCSSVLAD